MIYPVAVIVIAAPRRRHDSVEGHPDLRPVVRASALNSRFPDAYRHRAQQRPREHFPFIAVCDRHPGLRLPQLLQDRADAGSSTTRRCVCQRCPVLGDIMRKIAVARFCRTLATLISSACRFSTASKSLPARRQLDHRRRHHVDAQEHRTRRDIRVPLKETAVFPPMVVQMIGVGGNHRCARHHALAKIADFYEDEVDTPSPAC